MERRRRIKGRQENHHPDGDRPQSFSSHHSFSPKLM
jgi:hypothetical protein